MKPQPRKAHPILPESFVGMIEGQSQRAVRTAGIAVVGSTHMTCFDGKRVQHVVRPRCGYADARPCCISHSVCFANPAELAHHCASSPVGCVVAWFCSETGVESQADWSGRLIDVPVVHGLESDEPWEQRG